jgi:hypothetical protein
MSSSLQTLIALGIVAIAAAWLVYSAVKKRRSSGCGSEGCAAVSPEVKRLQARLKR